MTDALGLTIAAAQPMCRAHDVAENAVSHADVILAAGARVVVFPELSLTGYELDAPAVDPSDVRLRPVIEACATAASVALVGAPTSDDHGEYISVLAVRSVRTRAYPTTPRRLPAWAWTSTLRAWSTPQTTRRCRSSEHGASRCATESGSPSRASPDRRAVATRRPRRSHAFGRPLAWSSPPPVETWVGSLAPRSPDRQRPPRTHTRPTALDDLSRHRRSSRSPAPLTGRRSVVLASG